MLSDSTSWNLIEGIRSNVPTAWERAVRLYGPMVYRWAREAGLQPTDSADVVQDVFRSLFGAIQNFDPDRPDARFRSWLNAMTRHRLQDYFRRVQSEPVGAGGSSADQRFQLLPDQLPEDVVLPAHIQTLARRALALIEVDFQPQTWQAFWRVAIDGHAPRHVADELGMSIASVYKARSRVLQRLRAELGDVIPGSLDASES